jgi:hypothetical protein
MKVNHFAATAAPSPPSFLSLQQPQYLIKFNIDMVKKIGPITRQGHAVKEAKAMELKLQHRNSQ